MIGSMPWWAWLVPLARPLFQLALSVVLCISHRRATGSWRTIPHALMAVGAPRVEIHCAGHGTEPGGCR